jgi:hypothetical protein
MSADYSTPRRTENSDRLDASKEHEEWLMQTKSARREALQKCIQEDGLFLASFLDLLQLDLRKVWLALNNRGLAATGSPTVESATDDWAIC